MKKIKNIIFDFNGTLLDDVDICFNLLNEMLNMTSHPSISKETYLNIFTFPVIEYYKKAGFIFPKDDFKTLANYFFKKYHESKFSLSLYNDVIPVLNELKEEHYHLFVLSSSEKNLLEEQLKYYNIFSYFEQVIGQDDLYAKGKEETLKAFIKDNNINPKQTILVGDTVYDGKIAINNNITPVLIAKGHQSKEVLTELTKPLNNMKELLKFLEE